MSTAGVSAESLKVYCSEVLQKLNVPVADAQLVAGQLIESDMRGISTHGIMRLPLYAQYLKEGYYNPRPQVRLLRESSLHALFDGDRGMGFPVSTTAMMWCIDHAKSGGFAMAGVRNSHHNGASATYAIMAAENNLIGFASTGVIPIMAPPGSYLPTHGNNPVCFAMPRGLVEPMLVVDMATSVKAWGNILNYRREKRSLPVGWARDRYGLDTQDPFAAVSLTPIGEGGFKGFGLALAMDVLCGVLTGANFARKFASDRLDDNVGHFFWVLDPELFMPLDEFRSRLDETLREVRTAPTETGSRIYIPGEIEALAREKAASEGLVLPPMLIQQLRDLSLDLSVPCPL